MSHKKFGLLKRKECYVLTWKARFLLLALLFILFYLFFSRLPVFLSKADPVNGSILVLDGQLPDYGIKEAISIFESGNYQQIIVTGGNLPVGYYNLGMKTMAELSYATFIELGFDSTKLIAIPGGQNLRNRTYASAVSLKNWFNEKNVVSGKIDVLAIGSHARRSKYLFQMALGEKFDVGVVVIRNRTYDNKHWWRSSQGARTVISEIIGYLYVVFFFFPDKQ